MVFFGVDPILLIIENKVESVFQELSPPFSKCAHAFEICGGAGEDLRSVGGRLVQLLQEFLRIDTLLIL